MQITCMLKGKLLDKPATLNQMLMKKSARKAGKTPFSQYLIFSFCKCSKSRAYDPSMPSTKKKERKMPAKNHFMHGPYFTCL